MILPIHFHRDDVRIAEPDGALSLATHYKMIKPFAKPASKFPRTAAIEPRYVRWRTVTPEPMP